MRRIGRNTPVSVIEIDEIAEMIDDDVGSRPSLALIKPGRSSLVVSSLDIHDLKKMMRYSTNF